jgi:hypothetical protein
MSVLINASTSTGLVQSADTSGEIELQSNGTTALKVNTNEGIQILNCLGVGNATPSTSGAGITFPATQSASADANTLDDYEEGTFTPTLIDNSSNQPTSYGARLGTYTKIGNQVTIQVYLAITTMGGTISGAVSIGNMPFTSSSTTNNYQSAWCGYWATMNSSFVWVGGFLSPNTTRIALHRATSATATLVAMQASDWTSSSDIMISCTYRTS